MRRLDDPMMRALRDADPGTSPEVSGWVESSEAASIAERIRTEGDQHVPTGRQPTRKRPSRRLVIVLALVAVVASAIAASVTLRSRGPSGPSLAVCFSALEGGTAVSAPAAPGVGPVEACRRIWPDAFGVDVPARFIACVEPHGGFVVYPLPRGMSGSDACTSKGDALYVGE